MAERTPRRQSGRPEWTDNKAKPASRLFRRKADKDDMSEEVKEYVRGNPRKRPVRKEKEFKGSDKPITKGLRFDSTNPLQARQARRAAEGKHFIAPEPSVLKPRPGMKKLRPGAAQRRPVRKSNAETSISRRTEERAPPVSTRPINRIAMRTRRTDEVRSTEPVRERVPYEKMERKQPTLKEKREFAKTFEGPKPEKPKKKKEGRKYDRPSTIPGERVQKLIANAGLGSRREAEEWIEQGRVEVNGRVIKLGDKALPTDKVTLNGAPVQFEKHSYYMLHKPKGFVTTRDDKVYRNKTVMDLIPVEERIYPIGRLDKDTTGLLLFTSDGEFANTIMHPRYEIQKTYVASLDKPFNTAHVAAFEKGIRLKEGIVRARVRPLSPRKIEVTLHQGFNHVVKRIMKEMGYWVTDLSRTKVGPLTLDIPLGAYRQLSPEEVSSFSKLRIRPGNLPRGR